MITTSRVAQEKPVKVVFADTFYWIALTLPGDAGYARPNRSRTIS